jgi:RNA polymerase sigma factor (sigma-70 family)
MSSSQTSLSLLESLRDPGDESAWRRFDDCYRPMLLSFARRLGLHEHDAHDAAQNAILAFRRQHTDGAYDRQKGRFKNWLLGIARLEIVDLCEDRARQPIPASQRTSLEAALHLMRDPESLSAVWEEQWRDHILREAFARAKTQFSPRDVRIFEMLTVEDRPIADVAAAVSVPPHVVSQVKYKVLRYMRGIQAELEAIA